MPLALALHLLAALVWVGGMFFAILILKPAAQELDLPTRVRLWSKTLTRFMVVVWISVIILPVTGYWMIFHGFGGLNFIGQHLWIMQVVGWVMISLFLLLYYRSFLPLRRMALELLIPETGLYIERIRKIVQINLILGIIVVCLAAGGRYW